MKLNYTIFYSWQSDLDKKTTRYFIQEALKLAAGDISKGGKFELQAVIDRDTYGLLGSPSIVEAITEKIAKADIFVCDISIINSRSKGRLTPNPNVLFELGYAVSLLGWERIILVQNTAFGDTEKLPFDLRGRRVVPYNLGCEAKALARKLLREKLVETFNDAFAYYGASDYREKNKMAWWGTWVMESRRIARGGLLKIYRVASDSFFFDLAMQDGSRSGYIESRANIVSPHSAFASISVPDALPTELIFRRRLTKGGTWSIKVEQGGNFHYHQGMGTTFDGVYHQTYQPLLSSDVVDEIDMNEIARITGNYLDIFLNNFQRIESSRNDVRQTVVTGAVKGMYTIMESILVTSEIGVVWCAFLDPHDDSLRYFTNVLKPATRRPAEIDEFITKFPDRKLIENDPYSVPPGEHSYAVALRKRFSGHKELMDKLRAKTAKGAGKDTARGNLKKVVKKVAKKVVKKTSKKAVKR